MYSIHFIPQMLQGLSFRKFLKSGLNDKKMIAIPDCNETNIRPSFQELTNHYLPLTGL